MAKGFKTGGRVKGTPNKQTVDVRDSVIEVFKNLGGVPAMTEWARTNQGDYYRIFARLLPKDIHVDGALKLEDLLAQSDDPKCE